MNLPTELKTVIEDFERRRAWGQVQLDFREGMIVLVRKSETLTTSNSKPPRENNHDVHFASSQR
jgi:hypothetical protein